MSEYTNRQFSSDLDTFRSDSTIYTDSLTFSGSIAGAGSQIQTSTGINVSGLDFYQLMFDNSDKHSGKFRDIVAEDATYIADTTTPGQVIASLAVSVDGSGNLVVTGTIINPYAGSINITTTTINFRLVTYDTTLV